MVKGNEKALPERKDRTETSTSPKGQFQTCPKCLTQYRPSGRHCRCKNPKCYFTCHRDAVESINILERAIYGKYANRCGHRDPHHLSPARRPLAQRSARCAPQGALRQGRALISPQARASLGAFQGEQADRSQVTHRLPRARPEGRGGVTEPFAANPALTDGSQASFVTAGRFTAMDLKPQVRFDELLRRIQVKARSSESFISPSSFGAVQLEKC